MRHFQQTRRQIHEHLEQIERKAAVEMGRLQAENAAADARARETQVNLRDLEIYLAAGELALIKARGDFAALKTKVEATQPPDPVQFSALRDMGEQIDAFETRLVRMNIAITDAMVAIPQIRTAQEAARVEIRNIMDAMLFDMPRLKGAILQVAALNQINKAAASTAARRQVAREIGQLGADALAQAERTICSALARSPRTRLTLSVSMRFCASSRLRRFSSLILAPLPMVSSRRPAIDSSASTSAAALPWLSFALV